MSTNTQKVSFVRNSDPVSSVSDAEVRAIAEMVVAENQDFFGREVTASGPVVADERVLVTAAGVELTFPTSGEAGDEIIVGNRAGGPVSLIGAFDGETDAVIEGVGSLIFRWNEAVNEWNAVPFGQDTVNVGGGSSAGTSQLGL